MTVAELSLPCGWDEITPDWMTAALGNHFPGAAIDSVTVALTSGLFHEPRLFTSAH